MPFRTLVWLLLALSTSAVAAADRLEAGSGRFDFTNWDGPPLPVWYHTPKSLNSSTPVLFVMHGQGRNGDEYRDQWVKLSEKHGFLLVVPTFPMKDFPGREGYNFGNVFTLEGSRRPASQWGYTAVERVFDQVRAMAGLEATTYSIYGHSAGAQFVHRMPFFLASARAATLIPANAGAYMLPGFEHAFPYGLKASGVTEEDLKTALQKPLVVLLGDADINPNDKSLPDAPEARAQGLHRFSRGLNYFKFASEQAVRLGVPFRWKIATVPGVGHSNANMAAAAAEHLFGK